MNPIASSLLACDFSRLGDTVRELEKANIEILHFDIMDGKFVPNLSFGSCVLQSLRSLTHLTFDTHFMIESPEKYIEEFIHQGADIVTVHVEACTHIHRTLYQIKEAGARCGVALNPGTPLSMVSEVIREVDLLLVMTVNPGFYGQKFIDGMLDKIKRAKDILGKKKPEALLEVDGGIRPENVRSILDAGADIVVAGAAVFQGGDIAGNLKKLYKAIEFKT